MINLFLLLAGLYLVMSATTFIAFWRDKRAARTGIGRLRTPEASLHLLELLGGWPGALVAQRLLRHKSRKQKYIIILWLIILLHVVTWAIVLHQANS